MYSEIITDENYPGLNPVQFGYENCCKSHFYGPAVRTYWLIHYVVCGCGIFRIRDKEYKVTQNQMFVIPPFEETYYEADNEDPWSYIWIGFTTKDPLPTKLNDVISSSKARGIFSSMKECFYLKNGKSAFLNARLWDLFSVLLQDEKKDADYISLALDYMHADYMTGITVEKIAYQLGLDRSYFSSLFKKKVGVSPKQYLQNYRMNIALSLMLHNKKSVSVAAYSVGYNDIFTFSKVFKKHFGKSPTEYLKNYI